MIDVLRISPGDFHKKPQVGSPTRLTWPGLADFLSEPAWGNAKDLVGGWNAGLYHDNIRRKANLIHSCALVVDIDAGGDIDHLAEAFGAHDTILHETFSSEPSAPRCRLVFRFARPVSTETYEHVHRVVRRRLREELQVGVDEGAKDVSRLSYCPVRREGSSYAFRVTHGQPLDGEAIVAAHPPVVRVAPKPIDWNQTPAHRDLYMQAALRKAAEALSAGTPGERHDILCRESYSLARLGLTLGEIARALVPAAIHSMGEHRRREIERTIADGYMARTRAS